MTDTSSQAIASMRAICLENIKDKADWIKNDAEQLQRYSVLLAELPEYSTEAELAVALAWAALERAIKRVGAAHDDLMAKRNNPILVEDERDDEDIRWATETGRAQ